MRKSVNSMKVPKPSGSYSQVLKVGDFVYISGQVGLNLDLEMANSLQTQIETIFENTATLLSELNMHINQITKTVLYVRDDQDIEEVDSYYQKYFKHPFPARTVVFVKKLSVENALVEIAFDAIDLSAYEVVKGCSGDGCDGCADDNCEHS